MIGRVTIFIILVVALVSVFLLAGHVSYRPPDAYDFLAKPKSDLYLSTNVWGLFDPKTGRVLTGNNTDRVQPIASITKLFTAYAALASNDTDVPLIVNWNDLYTEGRAGKLTHGERVTPRELLFPLLLESSNDAGEAIKRVLANEFTILIDRLLVDLELIHTKIVDGSGLSAENVSTAEELATFYSYLKTAYPHILDITQLRMYITEENGWVNNDPARELQSFTGGKHGFTNEAGRTFIGTFRYSSGEGEIGIVLLGSEDLLSDITVLLAYVGG